MSTARRFASECRAAIALSLRVRATGACVHYKHDGARFAQPQTLKLTVGEEYTVRLSVNGESSPAVIGADLGGVKLHLTQVDERGQLAIGYWIADCVRKTRDGTRDELLLTVQIRTADGFKRSAVFPLQAKVYEAPKSVRVAHRALNGGDQLGQLGFEMVWDQLLPFSPLAHAHDVRFSRRASSALLAEARVSAAAAEKLAASQPPSALDVASAA
ncbi:hypothetical protein KFE25_005297 [Diacronema lutheri]|uniref:CB1 cannabinoid receptor-interacting protein 1 n=2 Tax=Diacronema lutheri TaxID=2081491 RepID=A0A8J6C8U4_DIALT|nr:hypothetical protein KFE25_005297 [Diacronema lutheri]